MSFGWGFRNELPRIWYGCAVRGSDRLERFRRGFQRRRPGGRQSAIRSGRRGDDIGLARQDAGFKSRCVSLKIIDEVIGIFLGCLIPTLTLDF